MISSAPKLPIRVLIVEDSHAQRELLVGLIGAAPEFEVVGTARNGQIAIAETQRLRPDVVAMDINLPMLDGYGATAEIMRACPTPVVMISGDADDDQRRSMQALAAGALAVLRKPRSLLDPASAGDRTALLTTLRLMAGVRVVTRFARPAAPPPSIVPTPARSDQITPQIVALAASTGGPAALQTILSALDPDFPLPIVVVQHITHGFASALIDWLRATVRLPIITATADQRMQPGHVYVAPDDQHLVLRARGVLGLQSGTSADHFCPSADMLFASLAHSYRHHAIGVILTGMGDDGAAGLRDLRAAGGRTLAQDEASCVVYGMPRAAVAAGAVQQSVSLHLIGSTIQQLITPQAMGAATHV